jgi:hypothetical protein
LFTIHRYQDVGADAFDADLAVGDWYIVPTVGADAKALPRPLGDHTGAATVTSSEDGSPAVGFDGER